MWEPLQRRRGSTNEATSPLRHLPQKLRIKPLVDAIVFSGRRRSLHNGSNEPAKTLAPANFQHMQDFRLDGTRQRAYVAYMYAPAC
ncbi:hypothetical protein SAMN05428989_3781 [Pseudoxanthomonas sp. GM95]|uniref:hypothetical protein n=1 Tax=Pseudoxanthomonas sp. GM95 TaxID=1881043 RepID=UPI0008CDAAA0|nr:hypothetical protein [Pseudoxanthomonas sp. GM95]SEM41263.1 hypothetical protein SAMN05428989_3781 [Pseudoxanthomonas sp. GM95]